MVEPAAVHRLLSLATMPLTVGSMAERLGADRRDVATILVALEKDGRARPESHGWIIVE